MSLTNSPYSFFKFDTPEQNNCLRNIPLCLPIASPSDINFQFTLDPGETYTSASIVKGSTVIPVPSGVAFIANAIASISVTICHLDVTVNTWSLDVLIASMKTDYPGMMPWTIDSHHGNSITSPVLNSTFTGTTISGVSYNLLQASPDLGSYYYLQITAYAEGSTDLTDYLNQTYGSDGTWSYVGGHYIVTGDISGATITIPGCTVTKTCNTITTYTYNYSLEWYNAPDSFLSDNLNPGDCFNIRITSSTGVYNSNCLSYTPDKCFTTRIQYRNNENAFGFIYTDITGAETGFYNIVRLPFFIQKPQTKTNRQIYRKSDGNYVKLKAIMEKEYEGTVDFITEAWHDDLAIALEHDDFEIWDDNAGTWTKYILAEGDYTIDWKNEPGINLNVAPANFKVKQMPFNNFNSNC